MKDCLTCNDKPIKNSVYKKHLDTFIEKNLPKDNKHYHDKTASKIVLNNIKPNKCIFYFATTSNDFTKKIIHQLKAYGTLKNSGITKTDENGNANIYLHCPQLYINNNGNVYGRHFHFIYWNEIKKEWDKNLYTQQILCNIPKESIQKYSKKAILIDAKPYENHIKNHIENSISIPYNKKWTEENIFEKIHLIKKNCNDKLVPIILYCSHGSNDGFMLYKKLNKLGFFNTMHVDI